MKQIKVGYVSRGLLLINLFMAGVYLLWWLNFDHADNLFLYWLLFLGEIYHLIMALTFWQTIWPSKRPALEIKPRSKKKFSVDIFIPVVSEPFEVVAQTVKAAQKIEYPNKQVYILNDGRVAQNPNWQDYQKLAQDLGCQIFTRTKPGGAKAGNVNHALSKTKADLVLIFDADMVAKPEFLNQTIDYFNDPKTGFVQTPQFYSNQDENLITKGSWKQQEFFFGSIMKGKEATNSSFICGTNVVLRRSALEQVGGMDEHNIAEDFMTSQKMHQLGWKSYYVTKVLATGLAPRDPMSYFTQQLRWARGSLEVLLTNNPLFAKGLSWTQRISYLSSALFYLNGLVVLIDILMPLSYFFFDLKPVAATTTSFAFYFLPFMSLSLYTLYVSSVGKMSFAAMSFSQSSFTIQLLALWSVLTGKKIKFQVTSKDAIEGNFLHLVYPHLIYIVLVVVGGSWALMRDGLIPSWVANIAWAITNSILFVPFILAVSQSLWRVPRLSSTKAVSV